MRYTILVAAALVGLTAPAFAQDRTIPAGALDAIQAPIDRNSGFQALAPSPAPTVYEGRSVESRPVFQPRHQRHVS